jgi:hypothetical protein
MRPKDLSQITFITSFLFGDVLQVMWRSFFAALCGAVVLNYTNPLGYKNSGVDFTVAHIADWEFFELVPFTLLGVLGVRGCMCRCSFLLFNLMVWVSICLFVGMYSHLVTLSPCHACQGLVGAAFCRLTEMWIRYNLRTEIFSSPILEVICVALVTAIFAFPNPLTRSAGNLIVPGVIVSFRDYLFFRLFLN